MTLNIGMANPFAYRPHVAHMAWLAQQLQRLGHRLFFLGCAGRLDDCNSRINKTGLAHKLECLKCRIGGIESYLDVRPAHLDGPVELSAADLELGAALAYSSAATALQVEHSDETAAADFQVLQGRLAAPAARAYRNTRQWIRENRLDSVFVFNGRFDLTRAIIEACRSEGTRFVSVERSWFGDGLQLLPDENCIALANIQRMSAHWADKPLTYEQATRANQLMTRRLRRTSVGEWRQYNVNGTEHYGKPVKYLFLPSSQHEWLGHADRKGGWAHPVDGLEYLFAHLGIAMSDLVVRGHPGWAARIKHYGPNRADDFYRRWTQRVGAQYIESSSPIDTHQLVRGSHLVLVNGSSASMEAAWVGKPLVSLVPAAFSTSGICRNLFSPAEVDALDEAAVQALRHPESHSVDPVAQCRAALRYMYCVTYRVMQFVRFTTTPNPFGFNVEEPTDLSGLESLAARGVLQPDDPNWAADSEGETQVVEAILGGQPDRALPASEPGTGSRGVPLLRRRMYRALDRLAKS